jgi:hypothetical protein
MVMEPGSLVMERKTLLGVKERAERLAREQEPAAMRTAPPTQGIRTRPSPRRSAS